MRATIAACTSGGPWLDDVLGYLDGSRALLARLLAEHVPEIGYRPPEGAYLAWLDCRTLLAGRAIEAGPAGFFLAEARVRMNEGLPAARPAKVTSGSTSRPRARC